MMQNTIAGIIIAVATIVAVVMIVRRFKKPKRSNPCDHCSADCGGCALHEELRKRKQ